MSAKYACITAHRREYPVRLMCRVLALSPAAYYAGRARPASARAQRDQALTPHIRAIHATSRGTYGAPRVQHALRQRGERVGRKRVARLMRSIHLAGKTARRGRAASPSARDAVCPNHLARMFAPSARLNAAWVADVTYLPHRGGVAYLAVLLDVASRAVIGWAVAPHLLTTLPLAALRQALYTRRPPPGTLHHSDRGAQYQSAAYQTCLAAHGLQPSLSATGNCYDNAVVESFFGTLKLECDLTACTSVRELRTRLFDYIDIWYNRRRLHSSLGYQAPLSYEAQLTNPDRAA
jgi:transposase InsO family protein